MKKKREKQTACYARKEKHEMSISACAEKVVRYEGGQKAPALFTLEKRGGEET